MTTSNEEIEQSTDQDKDKIYTDFNAFLKQAIHEYYRRSGMIRKANFIALLIASGEMFSMAMDSLKSGEGVKKLAIGAASVVALRIGLKYALSGPLGILLAGVTVASLVAYFIRNRREVLTKIGRYRHLVRDLRKSYQKLQSDYRDGRLSKQQRNLMVEGLMQRFLSDLDAA